MDIRYIKVNVEETIGKRPLMVEHRALNGYKDGVKGEQEGTTVTVLSESAGFEKVDVKIPGMMTLPFEFNGAPIQVEFEGLEGKLWQDWNNRGAIKLSATAKTVRPASGKKIQLNG